MSKKKSKSKKRNKRIHQTQARALSQPQDGSLTHPEVKLSQCMIVKNEEKNIERALSWAKGIAFEQIVVDTGSTDKTVELAEKMGAIIHRFEWINDFAAAKNFAMDKAGGDWIAILDADEYMPQEDAEKLIELLANIQKDPALADECDAITCRFIDLDDKGGVAAAGSHQRVFRNRPYLRFAGRIHEAVAVKRKSVDAGELRIMHTGYTKTAYKDTDKIRRNIDMLRTEHENDPENPDIMHYLANSISSLGTDEARAEAEEIHLKALASKAPSKTLNKELAYDFLIPRYSKADSYNQGSAKKDKAIELCSRAIAELPNNVDYRYYRAVLNNQKGDYTAAVDDLTECEKVLSAVNALPTSYVLIPSPLPLYYQLVIASQGLGDKQAVIRNSQIINAIISDAKDQSEIVGPYIRAMSWYGATDDEVFSRLADVYDLNNPKDMMFIARAAKDSGAIEFSRNVVKRVGKLLEG